MCGRFTNRLTWREIVALYRLSVPAMPERNLPARYNICPTDTIDAVIKRERRRELVPMRWGLVPSWWKKKAKEAPATFNARAETVAEKPMFRDAFKRSRCLIPASGYYEWQNTPTGKQPFYYATRDGSPLTFAELWDEWKDVETRQPLMSCTMIITNANDLAARDLPTVRCRGSKDEHKVSPPMLSGTIRRKISVISIVNFEHGAP